MLASGAGKVEIAEPGGGEEEFVMGRFGATRTGFG